MKSIIKMLKAKKNTVQPQQKVTNKNQIPGGIDSNNTGHCQGNGGW